MKLIFARLSVFFVIVLTFIALLKIWMPDLVVDETLLKIGYSFIAVLLGTILVFKLTETLKKQDYKKDHKPDAKT